MMDRLSNRKAVVTGSGQNIGRGVARRLADEGAVVTVVDLAADLARETAEIIGAAGGTATWVAADVTDDAAMADILARAAGSDGTLDILVNNAQFFPRQKAIEFVSIEDWSRAEAVGPRATFRLMQMAFPYLKASGRGSIVNVTSGAGQRGKKYSGAYAAAKSAILAITRVAANEWAQYGIRANAISPFAYKESTQGPGAPGAEIYAQIASVSPMKRGGDPYTDIAPGVAYLASDDAAFVTGTLLYLDGGMNELTHVDHRSVPGIFEP